MNIKDKLYIELFAGCGGLSLGLKQAGFDLFFANELSPMASETFALNLLGEDLAQLSQTEEAESKKLLWLKSNFPRTNIAKRLKENPQTYEAGPYQDITDETTLDDKLIVGDINEFLKQIAENESLSLKIKEKEVDLVAGGPPCQGFSLAGKREFSDSKNKLPLSFVHFVNLARPKLVLLENVKGIIHPFKSDGKKVHSWLEISKAFAFIGYAPVCMLVNSKYFKVPQNRPRFIMFCLRKDVADQLLNSKHLSTYACAVLSNSIQFLDKVNLKDESLESITISDLKIYDIEKHTKFFDGYLLPRITTPKGLLISSSDAIDNIARPIPYTLLSSENDYVRELNANLKTARSNSPNDVLANHQIRRHTKIVKARFRIYQLLNEVEISDTPSHLKKEIVLLIKSGGTISKISPDAYSIISELKFLDLGSESDTLITFSDVNDIIKYLSDIKSQKNSQRAIKKSEPVPAQLTIPDDFCHYSSDQLRTLSVREVARLQSFPDHFVFRSTATTGAHKRQFEVPQYTQVGNAVPPLLGYELGKILRTLISLL
ncbi:MAG: DNA cytosine methyltransferase [Sphingobacteriales bacterium]|nr:MAG: DNA cytosine methyltransferase [Sphingobacteriales bacterium]